MRYLRAVTFVIGLSLIAVAVANIDSVIETRGFRSYRPILASGHISKRP